MFWWLSPDRREVACHIAIGTRVRVKYRGRRFGNDYDYTGTVTALGVDHGRDGYYVTVDAGNGTSEWVGSETIVEFGLPPIARQELRRVEREQNKRVKKDWREATRAMLRSGHERH